MPRSRLHGKLLRWYDANKRDLPWRVSPEFLAKAQRTAKTQRAAASNGLFLQDPYAVWVSEIMLQQTQVATVIPYYLQWMKRFPSVKSLASASEQDVLSHWQGLGYYRRCRMLHKGAAFVVAHGFPSNAKEWMAVPGIGRYTAGAIASIAHGERVALVDGNVERVYARLTGDKSSERKLLDAAWGWASEIVPKDRPGDWNQALMELGATTCKPVSPVCRSCPLRTECVAFARGLQNELPKKAKLPKTVRLQDRVVISICGDHLGLRKIAEGKWWHGMWEFPRFGPDEELPARSEKIGDVIYHVTNHRISMEVFVRRTSRKSKPLSWYRVEDLKQLPMPSPQRKALRLALSQAEDLRLQP